MVAGVGKTFGQEIAETLGEFRYEKGAAENLGEFRYEKGLPKLLASSAT